MSRYILYDLFVFNIFLTHTTNLILLYIFLSTYNLVVEKWLQRIFNIQSSWVSIFNRTVFFAGMNTTQRCESMYSFFLIPLFIATQLCENLSSSMNKH
jgi:hypothetical protein